MTTALLLTYGRLDGILGRFVLRFALVPMSRLVGPRWLVRGSLGLAFLGESCATPHSFGWTLVNLVSGVVTTWCCATRYHLVQTTMSKLSADSIPRDLFVAVRRQSATRATDLGFAVVLGLMSVDAPTEVGYVGAFLLIALVDFAATAVLPPRRRLNVRERVGSLVPSPRPRLVGVAS